MEKGCEKRANKEAPNHCIIAVMTQVPFQLDVEIRTPLAGGDIPTLDAVLLGEISRLNPDAPDYARSPEAALETLAPLLKITNGIPHASALLFDAGASGGMLVKTSRVRREFDSIYPMGLKVKGRDFSGSDNKYRGLLSDISHRFAGDAQFFGVGDIGEIERALRLWRGIGAQWRNGWGEVGKWRIAPAESADPNIWGMTESGAPLRPLPRELFEKLGGDSAWPTAHRRVVPPYWGGAVPRVAAVVPDERRPSFSASPSAETKRREKNESVADFMLRRFACFMLPESELNKPPEDAVARAISRNYKHREKKDEEGKPKELRLGDSAIAIVSEGETILLSHAVPEGKPDDSFQVIPPPQGASAEKYWELLWNAAMTSGEGARVILAFQKKGLALGDIFMFSAGSDHAVVSGKNAGALYRSAIRRIADIARKGGFNKFALQRLCDDENRRRRDPEAGESILTQMEKQRERRGLSEDEMLDLQELLPATTPAGWTVLECALRGADNGGE